MAVGFAKRLQTGVVTLTLKDLTHSEASNTPSNCHF